MEIEVKLMTLMVFMRMQASIMMRLMRLIVEGAQDMCSKGKPNKEVRK
jgi:hypothetical protein